jgi:iron complex outermembrane receptor protein
MSRVACTMSLIPLAIAAGTATAQSGGASGNAANTVEEIVVTATRRSERIQDVPLSITAISEEELQAKGIVGFEGIARETPGAVLNVASDNNSRLTARGISTNGWGAGLQTTTTTYLDELPLTSIGNTVTLNPNLYDIERVEFLRGPQGTLFGSGSLSGALRILTRSPNLNQFDASALVDLGHTPDGDGLRQRYNGMVNIPLVEDKLALRIVGFHRNEEGFIDNIGLNRENSNTLKDSGGRAVLLWAPTERLRVKLLGSYEDSQPEDASLTNPALGERKRLSTRPDFYTSETEIYNATVEYKFDFADLTSSSTYSIADSRFEVDLAGTFGGLIPFYLVDTFVAKTFVQETRLVSSATDKLEWVVGGFYLHRDVDLDGLNQSTQEFLTARNLGGLGPDGSFTSFGSQTRTHELAGFGEVTWHFTDKLAFTGGLRYGRYGGTLDTKAGFQSNYFARALNPIILPFPLTVTPTAAATSHYPSTKRTSWKASLVYEPSDSLTTYASVSTGYRTPVFNARAGSVSIVDPNDLIIPEGAGSDDLTNYELGLKGYFLDGKLTAYLAAYFIDWENIQVQANRPSDSVQFATNVGRAESKGLEAELRFWPTTRLMFGLNAAVNDAEVTELTAQEALISGAVKGASLASPHLQGSFFGSYSYSIGGNNTGFTSFQVQHVGSFPNGFPNSPGTGTISPLYEHTEKYTFVNVQTGATIGKTTATLYVENLTNSDAVIYVHPEAFINSRHAILRPRTFGVRVSYHF